MDEGYFQDSSKRLLYHTSYDTSTLESYTANSIFTLNSTLVAGLFLEASASPAVVNNHVRCFMGTGGVAVMQPMVDGIASSPTFVIWGATTAVLTPLLAR